MSKVFSQLGQHLFIGLTGTELTSADRRLLKSVQPGGIVLFARNIESATQARDFCDMLHREFSYRPFIAIDQESGRVNRLREVVGEIPTIPQLKQSGAVAPVEGFGQMIGRWLSKLGIDINFAPVLDLELFDEKTDNALRERCWGRTADEVIRWAGAFLDAMEREGVIACPKHFPGLGGATLDSHEKLPTILRTRKQLLRDDVQPYTVWVSRLKMIMVGHGHYPAFDGPKPLPASVSHNVMTKLLREQMGYDGLIVIDDMEMGAITQFGLFEDTVVGALRAGADVILVCHRAEKALAAHEALVKAAEQGRIPTRRLCESAEHIARLHADWIGCQTP